MAMRKPLKEGDTVRLAATVRRNGAWDDDAGHAVIATVLSDIAGGMKLEAPLAGFRYWNEKDLAIVRRALPKRRVRGHREKS